jgi:hypothetical protein
MTTHDFVYQTFLIYIFIKSLVFFPLVWVAFLYWWAEKKNVQGAQEQKLTKEAEQYESLPALELLPQ